MRVSDPGVVGFVGLVPNEQGDADEAAAAAP